MVCSRPIVFNAVSGREKTMSQIHDALAIDGRVEVLILPSFLQDRSLSGAIAILIGWLNGLISGKWVPLQSLLFWSPYHRQKIVDALAQFRPRTVYFDGVRTGAYLPVLWKKFRGLRLVCDFDDLMSRRMEDLARDKQTVSLGYLAKYVPEWISRYVIQPLATHIIPKYEARALAYMEHRILKYSNAVVLVSSSEAHQLKKSFNHRADDRIITIPPSIPHVKPIMQVATIQRFVFVGSDSLLQNRLTIEYLVSLWLRLCPLLPLHIYGKQSGNYARVPGIIAHGFVDDISQAYLPGSIMLAPAFVKGGVKTKVLEAFAYGVPVVGNLTTFEGIDAPTRELVMDPKALEDFVWSPQEFSETVFRAAKLAVEIARDRHSLVNFSHRWRSVIWPDNYSLHLDE